MELTVTPISIASVDDYPQAGVDVFVKGLTGAGAGRCLEAIHAGDIVISDPPVSST